MTTFKTLMLVIWTNPCGIPRICELPLAAALTIPSWFLSAQINATRKGSLSSPKQELIFISSVAKWVTRAPAESPSQPVGDGFCCLRARGSWAGFLLQLVGSSGSRLGWQGLPWIPGRLCCFSGQPKGRAPFKSHELPLQCVISRLLQPRCAAHRQWRVEVMQGSRGAADPSGQGSLGRFWVLGPN